MNNFNQSLISHRILLHFFQLLFCFALTSCKGGCSGGVFKSNPDDNSLTHASSNPPSTTPGGLDFKTRCQDPSVVKCVSFDTPDDFKNGSGGTNGAFGYNSGIIPPSGTSDYSRATMDSAVKASGTGSLKFTIPSNSGADTSGAYFTNFSEDLSLQFDGGSEFYIQWRQRFSPEFITTAYDGGGGFKQIIVGTGDKVGTTYSSCTSLELPVYNHLQKGFPVMYNSCTVSTSHGPYDGFFEPYDAYDFKLQNARAAPGCLYSQSTTGYFPPNGNCFGYFANEWMTFQMHVQLGPRVGDEFKNSYVTLWMAREGKPSELVINWGPYNLAAGSSTENERFGKVWLLPYNTGKSAAQTHPTAYTWYDDLIISRSKIPDPTTSSSSNTLAEESMPSWRQGQMVGEWREISGSPPCLSHQCWSRLILV